MPSYCQRQDLLDRLTPLGVLRRADDDADGSANESELGASLDRAIAAASAEIDAALFDRFEPSTGDPDDWLRHRAVDLAAEHLSSRGGSAVPEPIGAAAARSRAWLEEIRLGVRTPPGILPRRTPGSPRVVDATGNAEDRPWPAC